MVGTVASRLVPSSLDQALAGDIVLCSLLCLSSPRCINGYWQI